MASWLPQLGFQDQKRALQTNDEFEQEARPAKLRRFFGANCDAAPEQATLITPELQQQHFLPQPSFPATAYQATAAPPIPFVSPFALQGRQLHPTAALGGSVGGGSQQPHFHQAQAAFGGAGSGGGAGAGGWPTPVQTVNEALMKIAHHKKKTQEEQQQQQQQGGGASGSRVGGPVSLATWAGLGVHMSEPCGSGPIPFGAQQCHVCRKMAGPPPAGLLPEATTASEPTSPDSVLSAAEQLRGLDCGFCEQFTCPACAFRCAGCGGNFCRFCTSVSYLERYEETFCAPCHAEASSALARGASPIFSGEGGVLTRSGNGSCAGSLQTPLTAYFSPSARSCGAAAATTSSSISVAPAFAVVSSGGSAAMGDD